MSNELLSVEELERQRLKAQGRNRICLVLTGLFSPFALLIVFLVVMEEHKSSGILFCIVEGVLGFGLLMLGFWFACWWILCQGAQRRYAQNFKNRYVLQVIRESPGFSDVNYYQDRGFSWDDIRNAAVVNCGETKLFESEDLITGKFQELRFSMSDVTTAHTVRRGKGTSTEIIFSGQVICLYGFDQRKTSQGRIQVFQKEWLSDLRGWRAPNPIQTEDAVFNSKFQSYAEDAHNAYYILTPHRIQHIQEFAQLADCQVALSFWENNLFIAVRRPSAFEPCLSVPTEEQTEDILKDLRILKAAYEILVDL